VDCRASECGACCIAISISSAIPGMPNGKPAGVRCIHLTEDRLCGLFGSPGRPRVCGSFKATADFCGASRAEAFSNIVRIERLTQPSWHAACYNKESGESLSDLTLIQG